MKRRVLVALSALIVLALFFVARNAASRRPQLMAAGSPQTRMMESLFLKQSRSHRWTAMMMEGGRAFLWDRSRQKMRADTGAGQPIFSNDEKLLAIVRPTKSSGPAGLESFPRSLWKVEGRIENLVTGQKIDLQPVEGVYGVLDCAFNADGSTLIAIAEGRVLRWNTSGGRLISNVATKIGFDNYDLQLCFNGTQVWVSRWEEGSSGKTFVFDIASGQQKQVYPGRNTPMPDERFFVRSKLYVPSSFSIHRVSNGKQVFQISPDPIVSATPTPLFSEDGRWLLVYEKSQAKLIEVGTWREVARLSIPMPTSWRFDDARHILTQDDQGRVWRWRLR